MLQDLRFAFRLIAKERWFSSVAIGVVALGIGVNATGFTIVNAAFLRGLPFKAADRIYALTWQRGSRRVNVSSVELQEWRERSRAFVGLAAYSGGSVNVSDDRSWPEEMRGARITANTFSLLEQPPLVGRDFADGEDRPGADPVVIISFRAWTTRYQSDPQVVGKILRVGGRPTTIVGVMPDGMRFPDNNDIWTPLIPSASEQSRTARSLNVFGRLRDGVGRGEALAELDSIARQQAAAAPDLYQDFPAVRVETFTQRFVGGPARIMFLVVIGAVGFVLLIACANVANLLLSRSAHRAREIAVRMALGASRWRIVRQLLLESIVLGVAGGGIGLLLAMAGVRLFDAGVQDPSKPYWIVFSVDYVVIGYVAAICMLTAVIFGLAPALHVSKTNNNEVLKEGGRGHVGSRRTRWLSGSLVVAELTLTVVLLVGAGLMIRSFINLATLDLGIDTDRLLTMRMQLPDGKYGTLESRRSFLEQVEGRLTAIPGVESVAVTTGVPPLDGGERSIEIDRNGGPEAGRAPQFASIVTISPRFFEVVGVPLVRGRLFRESDGGPGAETVIVNERLAARFFPGEDPVGRRIRFTSRERTPERAADAWRTIVGVSPSIWHGSTREAEPNPAVYLPLRQEAPGGVSVLLRTPLPPASVVDAVRRAVQLLDRDQPVFTLQTVEQMVSDSRWPLRVFGSLFAVFAALALALSSVGLYAVMAYAVTQRTQEIGVRMALGARRRQVSWLILERGLAQLAIGLTLGLAGALALSRVLQRVLVQISPADPITFAAITILLTGVSLIAYLLPAHRATRVDPLVALRAD